MELINPFPDAPWFSIDEDAYLMYLLKGYEIKLSFSKKVIYFSLDGLMHREDGPAIIWNNGRVEYRQHGKLHREDGPAFIWNNGRVEYWVNGKYHSKEGYYKALKDGTY